MMGQTVNFENQYRRGSVNLFLHSIAQPGIDINLIPA